VEASEAGAALSTEDEGVEDAGALAGAVTAAGVVERAGAVTPDTGGVALAGVAEVAGIAEVAARARGRTFRAALFAAAGLELAELAGSEAALCE
jgi:hypothetical protein